jgi:nucleotide-binding universal stress UspA family protein
MFHDHLLVATDLSPASLPALSRAAALARLFQAPVHLLYSYDPALLSPFFLMPGGPTLFPAQDRLDAFEKSIREQLQKLQEQHLTGLDVRLHLRQDLSPADAICTLARELPASLILVGTHGRTGLARAFTGSVAERVVRHAPCPVLTVRSTESAA